MDALLKTLLTALRATDTVTDRRRPDPRRTLQCDALEDRQLLSTGVGRLTTGAGLGHLRSRAAAHGPQLTMARQGLGHTAARGFRMGGPATSVQTLIAPQGPNGSATPAPANAAPAPATDPNAATPPPADTTAPAATAADTTTSAATTTAASDSQATTTTTAAPADATTAAKPQQPPVDNTQLKTDLTKLQTDIHDILAKSQVTVAQTVALQDDFKAIDKAATTAASQDALKAFQDDVKTIGDSLPTDDQKAKLVSDFTALVKSRGVTDQTLIDKTVADAEAIVASSGVTADDLAKLAADRQAIQTDFGKPTDTSTTTTAATTSTPAMPAGPIGQPLGLGALLARGSGDSFGPGDRAGGFGGLVGRGGSWGFAQDAGGQGNLAFGGPGSFASRPFGGRTMQINTVSARGVNDVQGGGFQGGGFQARVGSLQGGGFQGGGFDAGVNNVQYGRRGPSGPGVW